MSIPRLQAALKAEAKRAQKDVAAALEALARVHAERLSGGSRDEDYDGALSALSSALARLKAAGDLSGRLEMRFPTPKAPTPEQFASASDPYSRGYVRGLGREGEIPLARPLPAAVFGEDVVADVVPVVAFDEAISDLRERDPVGAADLRRIGLEVADLYGPIRTPEGAFYVHGFAAAKAADVEVAAAVKERLVAGMAQGKPTPEIIADLQERWDWPRAYSETIVRTQFSTATNAGRFVQGERVASSGVPVAIRFSAVMDSNTRPGHAAMDGVTADVRDPIWRNWSPPLGYG